MRLRSFFIGLLAALLLGPLSSRAELSEALKLLAAESDMIAVATVIEPPTMWGGSAPIPSEKPLAYWTETTVRVNILGVIKGIPDQIKPLITARIPAFAMCGRMTMRARLWPGCMRADASASFFCRIEGQMRRSATRLR